MMKLFMTAPFRIVGLRPARSNIHPTIPVVVDLPLVPATPMLCEAALNSSATKGVGA